METSAPGRSFGRIEWRDNILTLHMVNESSQNYAIFAEPLISIARNRGKFVRVKRRNGMRKRNAAGHLGEVYGVCRYVRRHGEAFTRLELYFGPADKLMRLDEAGAEVLHHVEKHSYLFPRDEFSCLVQAIETMYGQSAQFAALRMGADVLVL